MDDAALAVGVWQASVILNGSMGAVMSAVLVVRGGADRS
jgi:hypothetical protein